MMNPQGEKRPVLAACIISRMLMTARTGTIGIAAGPGAAGTGPRRNANSVVRSIPPPYPRERRCLHSCRASEMRAQAGEQAAAVGAAQAVFDVVFRMRHHAKHVAAFIDDAGDRLRRAIDVVGIAD